jgi:hypothetical protein
MPFFSNSLLILYLTSLLTALFLYLGPSSRILATAQYFDLFNDHSLKSFGVWMSGMEFSYVNTCSARDLSSQPSRRIMAESLTIPMVV